MSRLILKRCNCLCIAFPHVFFFLDFHYEFYLFVSLWCYFFKQFDYFQGCNERLHVHGSQITVLALSPWVSSQIYLSSQCDVPQRVWIVSKIGTVLFACCVLASSQIFHPRYANIIHQSFQDRKPDIMIYLLFFYTSALEFNHILPLVLFSNS